MIGIIDYRMGNLRSVQKALQRAGGDAVVLRGPDEAVAMDRLLLPGVGAFTDGMHYLHELGWVGAIRDFLASGRPFLGICLGMQLLFESSEEDAPNAGLAVLPGRVVRFAEDQGPDRPRLKVPHMGWNALTWTGDDPLLAGLTPGETAAVYFVHGYYVQPTDPAITLATTDYGRPFCAAVRRDNLWATQFHPEKSQRVGLQMLANFTRL
jgi:glutamine amidotransferase